MKELIHTGPWLVALAPAWFVFDVMSASYNVWWPVALLIAAGVELTGVSAYHTFTRLYGWNRRRRKSDPAAPTWAASLAVLLYIITGAVLTAAIKQDLTLALFFALAAAGYITIALNIDQDERERQVNADKADRRVRRTSANATAPQLAAANEPRTAAERSPEHDERLADVHHTLGGRPFKRADVQQATDLQKTAAANLVRYGLDTGQITERGRHTYQFVNGANK